MSVYIYQRMSEREKEMMLVLKEYLHFIHGRNGLPRHNLK
jgi:hypothetical protein